MRVCLIILSVYRMESLPAPSELVEDEWAAMRIRFQREGLQYDSLTGDQRLLQVQRIGFQREGLQYDSLTGDQRLLQVQRIS